MENPLDLCQIKFFLTKSLIASGMASTFRENLISIKVPHHSFTSVTMNRANLRHTIFIVLSCIVFSGCNMGPHFGPQGSIGMQRNRAVLHDPFPSNDLGPTIEGGRPLGFEQPWAEARSNQDSPYARRGAPVALPSGF